MRHRRTKPRLRRWACAVFTATTCALLVLPARAGDDPLDIVRRAEQRRVAMVERVAPAVVCIFDANQRGGGSGVLIDPAGYGLTNFHVIAGMLGTRTGLAGLNDGQLYPLTILGIDPTGDVAMFRLEGRDAFPYALLGDSDSVRVGDTAIAMGNPFVLSEDYAPSVSVGVVTGVNRYQWGVGTNLIYSDCIQFDAPINPGNSGGPLFNEEGDVIGINGRISVNTRGRFNVGFGYAISANQVKRFIPALRSGLLARHGTLDALVDNASTGVVFSNVKPGGAADRAGIRSGDLLHAFDHRPVQSRNHFASLLGTYPTHWPVVVDVERDGRHRRTLLRLDPLEPRLRAPFVPDAEINRREVERVLRSLQRMTGRSALPSGPVPWRATFMRREPLADSDKVKGHQFQARWTGRDPVLMIEQREGDVRQYEFDQRDAALIGSNESDRFARSTPEHMVFAAMYLWQCRLLGEIEGDDLASIRHVGAEPVMPLLLDLHRGQQEAAPIQPSSTDATVLDVLAWPLTESFTARLAVDATEGLLRHVSVTDAATGDEVWLRLDDYIDVGGARRPRTVEVLSGGRVYTDTYSNWEVGPETD